jgi:hypothetical protein
VMMQRMKNEGKESQCVKYKFGKYGCRAYHPDHAKIILTWSSTHSNSMESNLYLTLRRHVFTLEDVLSTYGMCRCMFNSFWQCPSNRTTTPGEMYRYQGTNL